MADKGLSAGEGNDSGVEEQAEPKRDFSSRSAGVLSPRKKWGFRVVTVLLASGVTALVFQLFLRDTVIALKSQWFEEPIYLQEPEHGRTGHRYLYDEQLGWKNIPNWSATTNDRPLTINSKGLRDREYLYEKRKGTKRILVLGDSFAWGYGVADDEIFTEQLEALLKEKPLSREGNVEVINTGVSGWGTDQEYLFLQQEGFKYSPDIVILSFFIVNDINNNTVSRQYAMEKPVFLDSRLEVRNVPVPKPFTKNELWESDDPLGVTIALLERIRDECEERGCQLLIMKFGQFLPGVDTDTRVMKVERILEGEVVVGLRIPYIDLDEQFSANGVSAETLLRGNDDDHWNAEGHRIVSGYLYDYLDELGWLRSE